MLDPAGRRADVGPVDAAGAAVSVAIRAAIPGTYLVIWRVVASDTHPAEGTFPFSVGRASSPAGGVPAFDTPARSAIGVGLQALARAVHFAGYALSVGVFAFRQWVLAPRPIAGDDADRRMWRLIGAGVAALLLAEPLALAAQAISLGGAGGALDPEVVGGALGSSLGRVLAQRGGAAVLLWVLIGAVRNGHLGASPAALAVLAVGAGLALVDGEAAHASGAHPIWLGFVANAAHEIAMALWLGTLAGLGLLYRPPPLAPRRGDLARSAGSIAVAAVVVLVASGAVMALQHLTGVRDFLVTGYGRTLALKVCGLVAALVLARMAVAAPAERRRVWRSREAAVLLCVLALAGLLVSLPPPS